MGVSRLAGGASRRSPRSGVSGLEGPVRCSLLSARGRSRESVRRCGLLRTRGGSATFTAGAGLVAAGAELVHDLLRGHLGLEPFEGEPDDSAAGDGGLRLAGGSRVG